jgi:hypothetical protein
VSGDEDVTTRSHLTAAIQQPAGIKYVQILNKRLIPLSIFTAVDEFSLSSKDAVSSITVHSNAANA